jgi:hypothetical protein
MLRKLWALQMLQMLMKMLLLPGCYTALTSCCSVAAINLPMSHRIAAAADECAIAVAEN